MRCPSSAGLCRRQSLTAPGGNRYHLCDCQQLYTNGNINTTTIITTIIVINIIATIIITIIIIITTTINITTIITIIFIITIAYRSTYLSTCHAWAR